MFGRPEVEVWFAENQLQKGSLSEDSQPGNVAHWFHGKFGEVDPWSLCSSSEMPSSIFYDESNTTFFRLG